MSTNNSSLSLSVARYEIFNFIEKHKHILCNAFLQTITDEDIDVLAHASLANFFKRISGIHTKFGKFNTIFSVSTDSNNRTKVCVTLPLHNTAKDLWYRCPIEDAGEVTYWYAVDTITDEYIVTQIRMRILDRIFTKIDEFFA